VTITTPTRLGTATSMRLSTIINTAALSRYLSLSSPHPISGLPEIGS
jgi:hypothetical protein